MGIAFPFGIEGPHEIVRGIELANTRHLALRLFFAIGGAALEEVAAGVEGEGGDELGIDREGGAGRRFGGGL